MALSSQGTKATPPVTEYQLTHRRYAAYTATLMLYISEAPSIGCRLNLVSRLLICPTDNEFEVLDHFNVTGDDPGSWSLYGREREREREREKWKGQKLILC
jgi:hypothetical protein